MASSLELVKVVAGRFHLVEEAVDHLRTLKGPVGIVAVCGRSKQGKSYLLNQLIGRKGTFGVGSGLKKCTEGIWMWIDPLTETSPDEQSCNLVSMGCRTDITISTIHHSSFRTWSSVTFVENSLLDSSTKILGLFLHHRQNT